MTVSLSGCFDSAPDKVELSNIRPAHVVPKSSPTSFVSTFEQMCLQPLNSGSAFEPTLRNASYVPTRRANAHGYRAYIVDDRRPAVLIRERNDHRACAVMAIARTGQTQRVVNAVPRLFPNAKVASPSLVEGAENVWVEEGVRKRVIFTSRDQSTTRRAQYRLAVIETK